MGYSRDFIDQVRRATDGVRAIGEVVDLKKRGSRWVGLCPFHQEKTPSFGVNDDGLWYCFGCSEGGDVFKFFERYDGSDFGQVVRSLAERASITVPEPERRSTGARPSGPDRERLLHVLARAQEYYRAALAGPGGEKARVYLERRGFDNEVLDRFGIGFAPAGWDGLSKTLSAAGVRVEELEAAGLAKRRKEGQGTYDLLRDRIVFPIRDVRGRPIAFGGRILDDGEPKYLNSPETRVFNKGRTLYGLGEAREGLRSAGYALLVEGYLDLLACAQHGFMNVVAPLGTAFTADHARAIAHHARKAVVAFDGDTAGRAAAERTVGIFLSAGFQVSVVDLPAGADPDSLLQERGRDGLVAALKHALPALSFLVARAGERTDLTTPQGKAEGVATLLGFVVAIEDRVERAEWIGLIADAMSVDQHLVARSLEELQRRGQGRAPHAEAPPPATDGETLRSRLEEAPMAERELLRALISNPEWFQELEELCGEGTVRDTRVADLMDAVAATAAAGVEVRPLPTVELLSRTTVDGCDALLARIVTESEPLDRAGARACALAIQRDALLRELLDLRKSIDAADRDGGAGLDALQHQHLALGRRLDELRRRQNEILSG